MKQSKEFKDGYQMGYSAGIAMASQTELKIRQDERKKLTHRHKLKPIQGTNYYIKRCEICGEIYADKKTTASKPSRPSLVRSDI